MRGDAEPLRHLPREWMYRAPLPRTKLESPLPSATFDGTLEVGEARPVEVAGWRGMAGHNWGAEHAATWIWLHGVAFEGEPGAWLDLSVGRVRVGPLLTPWIANGALHVGGERTRLGGPRPARVEATPEGCRVETAGAVVEARSPPARPSPGPTPTPAAASTTRSTARSRRSPSATRDASCAPRTAASTSSASRPAPTASSCSRSRTASRLAASASSARSTSASVFARWNEKRVSPPRPAHFTRAASSRSAASTGRSSETIAEAPGSIPSPARKRAASAMSCAWTASIVTCSSSSSAGAWPTQLSHAGETSSARASPASRSGPP